MSATPTDRERISSLEADSRRHDREIERLRVKAHQTSNVLAAYDVEDYEARLRKLEAAYHRAVGMAAALGAITGIAGGALVKALGG